MPNPEQCTLCPVTRASARVFDALRTYLERLHGARLPVEYERDRQRLLGMIGITGDALVEGSLERLSGGKTRYKEDTCEHEPKN